MEEFTIEVREDICRYLTKKLEKYGYTLEDLIANYLLEIGECSEPPRIITYSDLADNFEKIQSQLQTEEIMYISDGGELPCVIMSGRKYQELSEYSSHCKSQLEGCASDEVHKVERCRENKPRIPKKGSVKEVNDA